MRAQFKRPVRIGDKTYECGTHEIDAALIKNWYFNALVADGLAQIIKDAQPELKPEPKPEPEAPKVAPKVEPTTQPAPAKPAQHPKPVKRSGKK